MTPNKSQNERQIRLYFAGLPCAPDCVPRTIGVRTATPSTSPTTIKSSSRIGCQRLPTTPPAGHHDLPQVRAQLETHRHVQHMQMVLCTCQR